MEQQVTNKRKFGIDWSLMVSDRKTFDKIREVGKFRSGVFRLSDDGTVEFIDEATMASAASVDEGAGEYVELKEILEKVLNVSRSPFDPATDAVLVLGPGTGHMDVLSDGRRVLAKAWWARIGRRSVRRVNVEDTDDELLRFALEK